MLKRIGIAAALALAVGIVPMAGHATPGNACVAQGEYGFADEGDTLSCTYTAGSAQGAILQATPNHIEVTYVNDIGDTVVLYSQDSLSPPLPATYDQPVGKTITVTVGPDDAEGFVSGAIGLVVAGDVG